MGFRVWGSGPGFRFQWISWFGVLGVLVCGGLGFVGFRSLRLLGLRGSRALPRLQPFFMQHASLGGGGNFRVH